MDLERHAHRLPDLPVGAVVQVQNQKGKDPLRWDRSGVVVESLGNQQYTVKMDGSGRVSLRNRRFLRKIEPFVPRYARIENVPVDNDVVDQVANVGGEDVDAPGQVTEDRASVGNVPVEDRNLRRVMRNRRTPDWYEI